MSYGIQLGDRIEITRWGSKPPACFSVDSFRVVRRWPWGKWKVAFIGYSPEAA